MKVFFIIAIGIFGTLGVRRCAGRLVHRLYAFPGIRTQLHLRQYWEINYSRGQKWRVLEISKRLAASG
jgi:hypothetical protein